MNLLKYLEPMKNMPKRFNNLAFWRDSRKFKDDVVNALEYVDSWGENVESELAKIKPIKKITLKDFDIDISSSIIDATTSTYTFRCSTTALKDVVNPLLLTCEIAISSDSTPNYYLSGVSSNYTNGTVSFDLTFTGKTTTYTVRHQVLTVFYTD